MWWILGVVGGAAIGVFLPIPWPPGSAVYVAMVAVASMDALVGGAAALQRDTFSPRVFVEGWLVNTLFTCGLAFLGQRLEVQLYIAAATTLALRIIANLARLRQRRKIDPFFCPGDTKRE